MRPRHCGVLALRQTEAVAVITTACVWRPAITGRDKPRLRRAAGEGFTMSKNCVARHPTGLEPF